MNLEAMFLDQVDRFRSLVPSRAWLGLAEDLSRNEILALLHLHRVRRSRMSDLAAWLNAPLNTTTGVVARLQQRDLVERQHSPDDKRIVLISLTGTGRALVLQGIKDTVALIGRLFEELTPEEIEVVLKVVDRIPDLLAESRPDPAPRTIRRIPTD
ncbi:MarR family transcriptional regulator [Arachnia propionica]|uniref:MarR family transcriptional regulator n=1 Tax=Arachnia propionica TaxID=1750 RepID=A0A3P1T5Q5_9ACTN|nr:MarR family transcriptional regulator [Arachnia propionica]RRD04680.1 MarR family transcriptional regulator [Arachnia propionica]